MRWNGSGIALALALAWTVAAVAGPRVVAHKGVTCGMVTAGHDPMELADIELAGESYTLVCSARDKAVQCQVRDASGQSIGKAIPQRSGAASSVTFRVYPNQHASSGWNDASGHFDLTISIEGMGEDDFLHAVRHDTSYKLPAAPKK